MKAYVTANMRPGLVRTRSQVRWSMRHIKEVSRFLNNCLTLVKLLYSCINYGGLDKILLKN